jgi:divalent metal cation (Fe/Co/Zn/Cd) transporter
MLDGVDPEVIDEIIQTTSEVKGITDVGEIRARWIGHRLHAELNIGVDSNLSVTEGHEIAQGVRRQLFQNLKHLGNVVVHIDPDDKVGEKYHRVTGKTTGGLSYHSH